jgi:hypothetical protein
MHRRELGGSFDDVRYLESHAAADDAFRLIVAIAACTLGTAASFHREVVDCVSPQGNSLQRPLLKIDAKTS